TEDQLTMAIDEYANVDVSPSLLCIIYAQALTFLPSRSGKSSPTALVLFSLELRMTVWRICNRCLTVYHNLVMFHAAAAVLYLKDVCIGIYVRILGNLVEPGNRCYGVIFLIMGHAGYNTTPLRKSSAVTHVRGRAMP